MKETTNAKDLQLIVAGLIMMTIGSTIAVYSHFKDPMASPFFCIGLTSVITIVYRTQDVSKWFRRK